MPEAKSCFLSFFIFSFAFGFPLFLFFAIHSGFSTSDRKRTLHLYSQNCSPNHTIFSTSLGGLTALATFSSSPYLIPHQLIVWSLLEVQNPYGCVCPSVDGSVCHNFLRGREVTLEFFLQFFFLFLVPAPKPYLPIFNTLLLCFTFNIAFIL